MKSSADSGIKRKRFLIKFPKLLYTDTSANLAKKIDFYVKLVEMMGLY